MQTRVRKGGAESDTLGRKCLCNALFANIAFPQSRHSAWELPLVTAGDDARRTAAVDYIAAASAGVSGTEVPADQQ